MYNRKLMHFHKMKCFKSTVGFLFVLMCVFYIYFTFNNFLRIAGACLANLDGRVEGSMERRKRLTIEKRKRKFWTQY